ncbi:acyltransferase family protein [Bacillus sp. 31A1R]|uniref:Acyltransferase family protein n=1 Tax=Robertmurraya mangrovi TaxID=3098077 RepID=A0ABU5ITP3_9BACI|nr:acyltransferase family protein [Bacillus sp. 31A1R]MDZ5470525.1 acyltransferase family protein [Bacillus sp. 31A1R]
MKERDYYFDNGKFILIFFVVFGHFIQSFKGDSEAVYSLYKTIYTFHMPAFILVSGYFAKGFYKKGYIGKIAKKLIIPYLIFQFIYSVFYYILYSKSTFTMDVLDPHWSLWFLISLFFWNIMLILFARFKAIYSLSIALLIGLGIGYLDWVSNYLSLSRTFVFFPFFLLGYYMKKEYFYKLFEARFRLTAIIIFAFVFVGFYLFPNINYEWLLGSKPYEEIGAAYITSPFIRLGFYCLSFMMVMSFYCLIPRKKYFFTNLGKNTLYVYLLHGFFVRTFRESQVQEYFHSLEMFLVLAIGTLLMTLLLSSKPVTLLTQPIIELSTAKIRQVLNRASSFTKNRKPLND